MQWQGQVIDIRSHLGRSGLGQISPFLFKEVALNNFSIPCFCQVCIQRLRAVCPHDEWITRGAIRFVAGDVWEDFQDVCTRCGTVLDGLPLENIAHIRLNDPLM